MSPRTQRTVEGFLRISIWLLLIASLFAVYIYSWTLV